MTQDEVNKKQEAKSIKAANRTLFTEIAKFHEIQAEFYRKQAQGCDEIELVPAKSSGGFSGL